MKKLVIRCSTCKYHSDCYVCNHSHHDECLRLVNENLRETKRHHKYPNIDKHHIIHEYTYWEPKSKFHYDTILLFLNKEDFEI